MSETRKIASEAAQIAQRIIHRRANELGQQDARNDSHKTAQAELLVLALRSASEQLLAAAHGLQRELERGNTHDYGRICTQLNGAPAQAAMICALGLCTGQLKLADFESVTR